MDYTYDENGNLKKDLNKDIGNTGNDGIVYNHLNLPETVTMRNASGVKGVINYTYTAAGAKLQKQVVDYSESGRTITTTTKYIGSEVVESRTISPLDGARPDYTDKLLFIGHEEGRIRFEEANSGVCPPQTARLFYDYFLKDHLGNVRMVLTEQAEKRCYIAATVEDATWASESQLYNIVDSRRELKSNTSGTSGYPSFGNKFYRTNGAVTSEKTGLGIVLKVMKGDQVTITAESFYNLPGGNAGAPLTMAASDLFNALVGSSGFPLAKGLTGGDVNAILNNPANTNTFINTHNAPSNRAKAAVNWVLFDEQMRFVSGDYDEVQTGGGYKNHLKFFNTPVTVSGSGYLYIYVSNESNLKVFFDNLNVTHTNGAILEENSYYPFGLTMAGVSSKTVIGVVENKKKYNDGSELENKEFSDGSGIELYSTDFRNYDPQIGRFIQIDPLSEIGKNVSPYVFANSNPVLLNDPLGLVSDTATLPTVNITIPKKKPVVDKSKEIEIPYGELTSLALDYHKPIEERTMKLVSMTRNSHPQSRKLEGDFLKMFFTGTILRGIDATIQVVDFYKLASSSGKGTDAPLEIPLIGGTLQLLVDDIVDQGDQLTLEVASKQGYVPFARIMNSSVGRRSGLVGVYANSETMKSILANGALNLRVHKVYGKNGSYPDNPTDRSGTKFEYFIIFPSNTGGIVSNFGVMRIN